MQGKLSQGLIALFFFFSGHRALLTEGVLRNQEALLSDRKHVKEHPAAERLFQYMVANHHLMIQSSSCFIVKYICVW